MNNCYIFTGACPIFGGAPPKPQAQLALAPLRFGAVLVRQSCLEHWKAKVVESGSESLLRKYTT